MLSRNNKFSKRTKRGNIVTVVKEHYLRDDIGDGIGTVLESNAMCYIVPDTNVLLHQITLLENPIIKNVIILETVRDEVKNQNVSVYNRLMSLMNNKERHFYFFSNEHQKDTYIDRLPSETMNDRNDRAIRVATLWYMGRVQESTPVFLLTNDKGNLQKAIQQSITAKTIHQYVKELSSEHPDLLDLLSFNVEDEDENSSTSDAIVGKQQSKRQLYEVHLPLSQIQKGVKTSKYYQGAIHMNRNNINEGRIEVKSGVGTTGHTSIALRGFKNINRAVHGDIVAVELLPQSEWNQNQKNQKNQNNNNNNNNNNNEQPCGKVVGIIKRNWRLYCGSLDEDSNVSDGLNKVLFVPVNAHTPKIRIATRQARELMSKRITVAIDGWDVNSKYPDGHYVGTLGDIYDNDTESEVILLEHDIPHYQFSDSVLKCLPPDDWTIGQEEYKERRDLRHVNIMSVDPPGCTDIDDALHAHELPDGNFEVGVHIADVTHFVKDGTAIDKEAAKRGTTVYLVDRRIEMLPKLLTNNLCSLRANVERLAFSVIWKMSADGKILNVEFFKSVIKSRAALTYEEAQTIIDDNKLNDEKAKSLRLLLKFARMLKQKRMNAGALTLASPAVKFGMDTETMNPTDVELYQLRETNSMVEEFMLLANIAVAQQIANSFPSFACLRRHPSPNPTKFQSLMKSLKSVGCSLDLSSSKSLNHSLDSLNAKTPTGDYFNTLVRIMVTRCMEQAVYFISGDLDKDLYFHYGLAAPIYTHFTSPIRRYADVIVHRLLACSIGISSLPDSIMDKDGMRTVMDEINKRNRAAQHAERASVDLYTNVYFKDRNVVESAYITKVKDSPHSIQVFIPRYGFEHFCLLSSDSTQQQQQDAQHLMKFNEEQECITYNPSGENREVMLRMFEEVKVRIFVHTSKNYRRKLIVQLVDPAPPVPYTILPASTSIQLTSTSNNNNNKKKRKRESEEESEQPKKKTK